MLLVSCSVYLFKLATFLLSQAKKKKKKDKKALCWK